MTDLTSPTGVPAPSGKASPKRPATPRKAFPSPDAAVRWLLGTKDLRGARATQHPYLGRDGVTRFIIARFDFADGRKKTFRQLSLVGEVWVLSAPAAGRPLYRLGELVDARRIYIAEGEKTADALVELGLVATTSSQGSGSAVKTDWSPLAGKEAMLAGDNDLPGEKYVAEVTAILFQLDPRPRVRVLVLPDLPPSGDAVEFIAARRETGANNETIRADIEKLADAAGEAEYPGPRAKLIRLADVKPERVEYLWPERFPIGKLSLLAGDPGKGKSFITLDMAARVSSGTPWPDRRDAPNPVGGVVIMSAEDDVADTIRPRLIAQGETRGSQALVRPKKVTLGAFADEFPRLGVGPRGERLAVRSIHEYRAVLNRFVAFIGRRVLLEQVTLAHVQDYLAELRSKSSRRKKALSTASLNKHKRAIKAVFNVAVRQLGYLNFNPLEGLRQDKIGQKTLRYVTPLEFAKLLDAAGKLPNRALWWTTYLHLAYTCGARSGGLTHLQWRDVDFEHDAVTICAKDDGVDGVGAWRPKDYDSRTIPLPKATMEVLARWHSKVDEGSTFVFISPQRAAWIGQQRKGGTWKAGRTPLNNITRDFATIVANAGVPHCSLHDLRRAAISHWARKLPAALVQKLAGHSNIATTMKYYVSIRQEDLDAARDVTAAVLAPSPEAAA